MSGELRPRGSFSEPRVDEAAQQEVRAHAREATADTCGDLFHRAGGADRLLVSDDLPEDAALTAPRGHRAIGVVYRPSLESGNYVPTVLPDRYDAVVHVEETTAVHPLQLHPDRERVPELCPSGV